MSSTVLTTVKLPDGRVFPTYNGETLSWSLDLYHTYGEEKAGYPRLGAVVRAMREHRPEQLAREVADLKRACFDRVFGRSAQRLLDAVNAEITAAD